MKKIITFCLFLNILQTFGSIQELDNCNLDTSCDECFRETQYLYTCNPQQTSCQKDTVTGLNDIATNVAGGDKVMYQENMGTYDFDRLQTTTDWTMSSPTLGELFEVPQDYLTPANGAGLKGYQYFASSAKYGHLLPVGTSVLWTQMKSTAWLRPDVARSGTQKNSPAYKVLFSPRLCTNSTTCTNHDQCIFYYVRFCGDNVIDDGTHGTTDRGEQCDDGNMTSGDGCSNTCMTETTPTLSCTNLTLDPTTLTNAGGNITATCAATNATQYKFVLKQNGTEITTKPYQTSNQVTFDLNANATLNDKNYTVECFVKNATQTDITSASCDESITVPGTQNQSSCTNLTIDPPANATLTGGGSATLTCAGSGTISSYSIVVKKPDGTTLTTINTASGTATIPATPTGTYTATCFVNNQTVTTPACEKSIQNNASIPEPVCSYLAGVPNTLETNQSFTYTCRADRAKTGTQFTISGITPVKNETSDTDYYTDSHTFSTAGDYTVSCKVNNGAQVDTCQKTVTVTVPRVPNVTIDKRDANPNDSDGTVGNDTQTVSSGAKAIFKIKVTNNGTEDLKSISLSDTVAPNCAGDVMLGSTPNKPSTWSSFSTGGSGSHTDTLLQPGEWFEYTCEKDNTLGEYTNTAEVDATGNTSGIEVSDTDPTNILLEPLCTNLDVTPSTTTTNTLVAYNCTARGALSYQITRDGSYASSSASGTMNFTTAGQYELKCFINNKNTTPPSCVKNITITNPPIITIPSIFIDKDDSTPGIPDTDGNDTQRVQNNGTATFTIRVQNNGNEALKTVVIDDPLASDCARTSTQTAVLYAGGTTTNFDVGETFSYLCTKTNVTSSTFTHNKNTASAKGVGVLSSINVTDSDVTEIYMKQNNPNITIDKDDDDNSDDTQEIDEDEIAQFTIKVTNNGDESLENVRIHDDLAAKCEKNESETRALIRAIGNKDALFDPDEYFSYSCRESSISPDSFPDDINTACVAAIGIDSKKGVDECDDTEIIVNKIEDEENLMCLNIESSKGSFGGAPFRTTITCDAVDYDSCEIEVMLDGEVIDTYDACSQSITFSEKGNYSVACIVNDERTPDCEMEIEVAAMTDIPTGAKICILAFLSLLLTALGTHLYKKKTS